jgi:DmsE family decaheme c-type cytochrome
MQRHRRLVLSGTATALLGLVVLATSVAASAPQDQPPAAAAASLDVGTCMACHEAAVTGMKGTPHAGVPQSCASCHQGVEAHAAAQAEGTDAPKPTTPRATGAKQAHEASATCLTCHDSGHQANFEGGVHDRRGVACASCHSVHAFQSVKGQLKTAREPDTCFTCHTAIRSKGMRSSHHPVREGLMACSSCHDPHDGTKPKMVSAEWVNEKCLSCHTEKRGPFLWEHAPVRENCMNCHDPHGSNHEKLLVAKQPYLCQRCHLNTRHPGTLYDGRNTLAGTNVSNRAIEHSCRNCHQNVHGGNAPSGPYLGR